MALPKKKFREIVLQLLYCEDLSGVDEEIVVPFVMGEFSVTRRSTVEALQAVRGVQAHLSEIDAHISEASESYRLERIQAVERNILRLAVYEMKFDPSTPPKVAIAEALRLSRKFSTTEAASFVNAILDHLYQKENGEINEEKGIGS